MSRPVHAIVIVERQVTHHLLPNMYSCAYMHISVPEHTVNGGRFAVLNFRGIHSIWYKTRHAYILYMEQTIHRKIFMLLKTTVKTLKV